MASHPTNFYDASPNLRWTLLLRAGEGATATMQPMLADFGRAVAEIVDPAVEALERNRQLPAPAPYDAIGRLVERIDFHPAYRDAGRAVWSSGLLAVNRDGNGLFEQAALFYLLSHAGEGGHSCPAVCTAGLARALERRGTPELKDRYLPGIYQLDYDRCLRGSQFLTEIHGGSDVGANAVVAVADGAERGGWRISGEKWFCSVADAELFAVTARPEGAGPGTRGLGCFLVPRTLDGSTPNGFRIRRLKDKLGTRCLASAEIDFDGALGWPVGEVDDGFHVAVEEFLNTSRWLNAVGSTGLMRRAYLEASSFARHRRAFGVPIASFPILREQLAEMKIDEAAALASTMALTGLLDRLDHGRASDEEAAAYRVLVNANKYLTSIVATDVVHRGIEVLGGNGTIETFSPLPRLYRDAIVYESWEGTHNVLCAQVHRDCSRLGLLDPLVSWIRGNLRALDGQPDAAAVGVALDALEPRLRRSFVEPATSAAPFRRQLGTLVRVVQATCLLEEAAFDGAPSEKAAGASLYVRRHLVPGHEPEDDPAWTGLVDGTLADEAG